MQRHIVICCGNTVVLNCVTQSDILEIYNLVEDNYKYDIIKLLEKHIVLTLLPEINVF